MRIRAASIVVLVGLALPLAANAQTAPQSSALFDGDTVTRSPQGAARPLHVSVRIWKLSGRAGAQPISLPGFYLARLVSGDVSTVIGGVKARRAPEDLWTVKAGSSMQVQVLGQYAVIETIAVSPSSGKPGSKP